MEKQKILRFSLQRTEEELNDAKNPNVKAKCLVSDLGSGVQVEQKQGN